MNNDKIMDISPISYTNKDFRAIYEELITLVNDLTARWDPTSTNESDPGLVLLKLKAFLADKLNYNIDKNTLENFPSQATQRGNAQKLYDILGYNMQYYKSATTTITMRYRPTNEENGSFEGSGYSIYEIPAFTQLTDDSNTINYVTTKKVTIPLDTSNLSDIETKIIEGVAQEFLINGNSIISVDNLDADYRLYFTESMIASNGIYVSNISSPESYWEGVNNLESTQLGQKVFKFGVLPTTNTCYLEFPQDAATLFGDGISIKYITTTGVEGNIAANILTSLTNDLNIDIGNDKSVNVRNCTLIVQPYSATNGEDPESLQNAYRNCKKTIDTFNTLVTTQDYTNAIYNNGTVSNVVVGDRTDDLNHSYKVVNKTIDGDRVISLVDVKEYEDDLKTPKNYYLNAFNVSIYALNNISSINDKNNYNYTFQTSSTTLNDAQDAIENYKSIQHDYIDTIGTGTEYPKDFIFKGLAKLEGKIYTYQKVTTAEANEILKKVNIALYQNFNARKIDFGAEFNYDDLIRVVEKSDDRIKTIVMDYPEYSIARMKSDNTLKYMDKLIFENYNSNDEIVKTVRTTLKSEDELDIIAKSILAGVTPYMIFDDTQILDYTMGPANSVTGGEDENGVLSGEIDKNNYLKLANSEFPSNTLIEQNKGIAAITTSTQIKNGDTLLPNENIFCVGPSYISKAQLSTCLYYTFISNKVVGTAPVYKITSYYSISYDPQTGSPIKTQIKKSEYDIKLKENSNSVTTQVEIVTKSIYNSTSGTEYITKSQDTQDIGVTIPANSYYKMGSGEALFVSESISNKNSDTTNLITDGSKNFWAYYGSDETQNIICPTMEITATPGNVQTLDVNNNGVPGSKLRNLGTSNQIEILGENKVQINPRNKTIYAVWSMDNLYNQLFDISKLKNTPEDDGKGNKYWELTTLLQNNDLFIYTDEKKQSLILLGSGTEVSIRIDASENSGISKATLINQFTYYQDKPWSMKTLDITSISADGLNAAIEWNKIPTGLQIYTAEKQIISLGEGTTVKFDNNNGNVKITNELKEIKSFEYKYEGENQFTPLPKIMPENDKSTWKAFSRLQLVVNENQGQKLDASHTQVIALYQSRTDAQAKEGTNATDAKENIIKDYGKWNGNNFTANVPYAYLAGPQYVTANSIIALTGGVKQNSAVMTSEGELENTLQIYVSGKTSDNFKNAISRLYPETSTVKNIIKDENITINEDAENGYTQIKLTAAKSENEAGLINTFTLKLSPRFENALIPILFTSNDGALNSKDVGVLNVTGTGATLECVGSALTFENGGYKINGYQNKYIYYFKFFSSNENDKNNISELTLNLQILGLKIDQTITIYNPLKIKEENKLLECTYTYKDGNTDNNESVKDRIENLAKRMVANEGVERNLFNYGYRVNEEDLIEDPLAPESFFKPTHVFNKYTIPQLDTNNINISISNQSLQSTRR